MLGKFMAKDTLVVSKLDRLGRDAPDVLATIQTSGAFHVEVVVRQLDKLDPTSPEGILMWDALAALAEMEQDLIAQRTQLYWLARRRKAKCSADRPNDARAATIEGS